MPYNTRAATKASTNNNAITTGDLEVVDQRQPTRKKSQQSDDDAAAAQAMTVAPTTLTTVLQVDVIVENVLGFLSDDRNSTVTVMGLDRHIHTLTKDHPLPWPKEITGFHLVCAIAYDQVDEQFAIVNAKGFNLGVSVYSRQCGFTRRLHIPLPVSSSDDFRLKWLNSRYLIFFAGIESVSLIDRDRSYPSHSSLSFPRSDRIDSRLVDFMCLRSNDTSRLAFVFREKHGSRMSITVCEINEDNLSHQLLYKWKLPESLHSWDVASMEFIEVEGCENKDEVTFAVCLRNCTVLLWMWKEDDIDFDSAAHVIRELPEADRVLRFGDGMDRPYVRDCTVTSKWDASTSSISYQAVAHTETRFGESIVQHIGVFSHTIPPDAEAAPAASRLVADDGESESDENDRVTFDMEQCGCYSQGLLDFNGVDGSAVHLSKGLQSPMVYVTNRQDDRFEIWNPLDRSLLCRRDGLGLRHRSSTLLYTSSFDGILQVATIVGTPAGKSVSIFSL